MKSNISKLLLTILFFAVITAIAALMKNQHEKKLRRHLSRKVIFKM